MPLEHQRLVIDPKFPGAERLELLGRPEVESSDDVTLRNSFWSWSKRSDVVITEKDGKIRWGIIPGSHHIWYDIQTLDASVAWGIEQEARALQTLGGMLRHLQFKAYLLTGMFMEKSERSDVTYVFRKLRPTVALSTRGSGVKILCCMCLHPVAYYAGSWAGAMCPTDDVIAHLVMMRGDEPMFWRRANQHPAWRPEAGL
jgi:hypothetical protein